MFLDVSGMVAGVDIQQELDEAERAEVADRLLAEQRERFDGVRKAAYTAAGVNPATWARATAGLRVRPDRLVQIVKAFWPESRGQWELVPPERTSHRGWPSVPKRVEQGPWTDEVENAMADVDARFIDIEQRVRDLEQQVAELQPEESDPPDTIALAADETPGRDEEAEADPNP